MIAFTSQLSGMPNLSSIKEIETEIAAKLAEDLQQKYQAESDFNGSPWVPKKGSGKLLVLTGATFGSLQSSGNVVSIAGMMIYHQDGTSRLPARPIIGVGSEQEKIALEIGTLALEKLLN